MRKVGEETMMGRVIINQNSDISSTELSNIFIDEYLSDANDAEIKVYLYLLRMMCSGRATSVSDLADKFNYTEKDVLRALTYWEGQGLMSLEYGARGQLAGIHMQDIMPKNKQVKATLRCMPAPSASTTETTHKEPAKKAAHHDENPQMLFVAEQYFGRPLNPNEIKTIFYIQDDLEFSEDLIDYLLQHCVTAGKKDFDYVRKVALNWHEKGIATPEAARLDGTAHKNAYAIMRELGMQNAPTKTELAYFDRWQTTYGFNMPIITEACRRTVLQTQNNRLKYCDSILRNWHDNGVRTTTDIKNLDDKFGKMTQAANASKDNAPVKFSNNKFNRFKQNDINLDSIEDQLLDN